MGDDGSEGTLKTRGLLHVPSRSSSQKIQPSPTSTGLSGATASDPRESIGGKSKESKGSILGRRRNGSTSTSKMSITPPAAIVGPTGDAPPSIKSNSAPKKKSFFAKLCCGVPDHADGADSSETALPPTKVTKVGQRPTTSSKPDNVTTHNSGLVQPQSEKEIQKRIEPGHDGDETNATLGKTLQSGAIAPLNANGEPSAPIEPRDQPSPNLPKDAGPIITQPTQPSPAVLIQSPLLQQEPVLAQDREKDEEGDTNMTESNQVPTEKENTPIPTAQREEPAKPALPPPPPVPQLGPTEEERALEPVDGKQQWLLPPIAPRFKGKKCLVLDLDETLVHSSFKVSPFSITLQWYIANGIK